MLVRQRLRMLQALAEEYALTMEVRLVKSCQNHAGGLTRVPQRWLDLYMKGEPMAGSCTAAISQLKESQVANIHQQSGHLDVKRTLST